MTIQEIWGLGENHLRIALKSGDIVHSAVAWNMRGHHALTDRGREIAVAVSPELNVYSGVSRVQLGIKAAWLESEFQKVEA